MAQNRDAPAYQEYAAVMLAKIPFRMCALEARGLLFTMRLECWVNGKLPADPHDLAQVLGVPETEVSRSLPLISSFFEEVDGLLICPELENYREHIEERRRKLSAAGKEGAAKTNRKKKGSGSRATSGVPATPSATPTSTPQPPQRGGVGLLVQSSTDQPSQDQLTGRGVNEVDDWLAEYDEAENF